MRPNVDRYDVLAKPEKPEEPPKPAEMTLANMETRIGRRRARMRNLLADRLQLVVRRQTKEMPVYAISVAKGGHIVVASPRPL